MTGPHISRSEWLMIIRVLEDHAANTAGHTQEPDLIDKEELPEWHLAQRIRRSVCTFQVWAPKKKA